MSHCEPPKTGTRQQTKQFLAKFPSINLQDANEGDYLDMEAPVILN